MKYVSTDESMRKEGSECEEKIDQFRVSVFSRKDIYEVLKDFRVSNSAQQRLLNETLQNFEDNGLKLPEEIRSEVLKLNQALASVESQYSTFLNEDNTTLEFAQDELNEFLDFLNSLKKNENGKYIVTTKTPHYVRVMENASRSDTRKKMAEAYESRAAEKNIKLLEQAIELRQKIAALMGYKTWVDYRTHARMAKNSETVSKFLNGLKEKLSLKNKEELERLFKFKKELEPAAVSLNAWDISYFSNQLKKRDYSLDDEQIRAYFPAETVVSGMFQVYSRILGVRYIEVKNAKVWAEGVKLYQIRDKKRDRLIGYFYTDFFPRAGKYGHAAAFSLQPGYSRKNGTYSKTISAIVANFSPAEGTKPALLPHSEVKTLFHEFGHIMHQTLTQAPFASLSGSSVDRDLLAKLLSDVRKLGLLS